MNELQQERLILARDALAEAQAVRDAGMDLPFILNSLYLAYYYPVVALVCEGRVPETMQSVTIGLFDQQFVRTGKIETAHADAVRRMFELKPKCGGGSLLAAPDELDRLFHQAGLFHRSVEALLRETP